jgi:predicted TPR repeat methyltransferase
MDRYAATFETWNKVSQFYEDKFMDLTLYDDTYDFLCEQFQKQHSKLLDLGCGPGNITRFLLAKRPDFTIKGVDVAPNMVQLAQKNNPAAAFEVLDVRNLHQIEERYDGIVCGFCLPYLSKEDVAKLMDDVQDILSDDGVLYLSFVEGEYEKSGFQYASSGDGVYFYYHQEEFLKSSLQEKGFEIIRLHYKEYEKKEGVEIHTVLIARKK